ncbi:hypothetical protein Pint_07773 [Pistacia integerrima]|uniref:Uncharacterized protein n=1 Tax=Pistacia integerrima TaxID=434235 RepID=A0ACC0XTK1_9ROSI|nr:hypothetical protein Pint_07773 [Pistacia integerrima]
MREASLSVVIAQGRREVHRRRNPTSEMLPSSSKGEGRRREVRRHRNPAREVLPSSSKGEGECVIVEIQ